MISEIDSYEDLKKLQESKTCFKHNFLMLITFITLICIPFFYKVQTFQRIKILNNSNQNTIVCNNSDSIKNSGEIYLNNNEYLYKVTSRSNQQVSINLNKRISKIPKYGYIAKNKVKAIKILNMMINGKE